MARYRIENTGMGAMLSPPNHAEHSYSVSGGGSISLRYALELDDIPEELKVEISALLKQYPGEFTEEWEHSCYNYFRDCYSPYGVCDTSSCVIADLGSSNIAVPENHLAYLHIKSFFPDYLPNEYLIRNNGVKGKWSSK